MKTIQLNEDFAGFGNWATYNAALYIDNERHVYEAFCRLSRTGLATPQECEELFLYYFPDGTIDMSFGDLCQIDWEEIAEHINAE